MTINLRVLIQEDRIKYPDFIFDYGSYLERLLASSNQTFPIVLNLNEHFQSIIDECNLSLSSVNNDGGSSDVSSS